jgi:transcriptional regulator
MEARLAPKTPWRTDKLDDEALARLYRMIVPVEMEIEDVRGTWKVNQNKTAEQALSAASHMEATGFGQEIEALAALMRRAHGQG